METESNYTAIIKSRPERGQPCLTPCCSVEKGEEKPLLMTQLEMFLYITLIQVLKFSPKLKASRTLCRKSHSRLSKCFLKVKKRGNARQILVEGELRHICNLTNIFTDKSSFQVTSVRIAYNGEL